MLVEMLGSEGSEQPAIWLGFNGSVRFNTVGTNDPLNPGIDFSLGRWDKNDV